MCVDLCVRSCGKLFLIRKRVSIRTIIVHEMRIHDKLLLYKFRPHLRLFIVITSVIGIVFIVNSITEYVLPSL